MPSRRAVLRTTADLALTGLLLRGYGPIARAEKSAGLGGDTFHQIDTMLRVATTAQEVPGVVALAASDHGIEYEGVFGSRRLQGPAMTRDTVFRVASMIKPITSVAALQLVERGKLSLDGPVPNIDPALGSPQVLTGFDAAGTPRLRPAKWPITLRHLLTHTSGFTYRLWDAEAVKYYKAIDRLPSVVKDRAPRTPLMFDPGDRWQYGAGIDWVGRIVESVSGESLDEYFRKNIFEPLGMKDTAFVISLQQTTREASLHRRQADGSLSPQPIERQTAQQHFSGGGGIYSTGPDYLTFIRMLQGGSLNGIRILHPDTVALMGENQIGKIEAGVLRTTVPRLSNDVDFFPGISLKWGFGHMINMQPSPDGRSAGSLSWGGLFNTYYWVDPKKRIAAAIHRFVGPSALT
jgi:CubicO group peptidase (beta-lactamase class C family)